MDWCSELLQRLGGASDVPTESLEHAPKRVRRAVSALEQASGEPVALLAGTPEWWAAMGVPAHVPKTRPARTMMFLLESAVPAEQRSQTIRLLNAMKVGFYLGIVIDALKLAG